MPADIILLILYLPIVNMHKNIGLLVVPYYILAFQGDKTYCYSF